MKHHEELSPFKNLKFDIPASIVVFLVALPLCLGIASVSGASAFSGVIAGIIGGIVVGGLSGSPLGVSGPAAGLAIIVLHAIKDLGFEKFLVAVVIAGVLQLILGFVKAGGIAYYFPSSVIHGMLAGIGILIFFKEIPHAFGYDKNPFGEEDLFQPDGQNTFSELWNMLDFITPGALIVTIISLIILIFWSTKFMKKQKWTQIVPGPLVAVTIGIVLYNLFHGNANLEISSEHLVSLPNSNEIMDSFTFPDFTSIGDSRIWVTAIVISVVASIETLLCVEASDKIDPFKRITPANRELKAQGVGNIISGLIGGIPITQVIVRSSANQQSGGRTKASAILHGFFLLISVVTIPFVLNMIPLATLAAILLIVGFKLANPKLFKRMFKEGWEQFVPFVVTIIGILATNLLYGIGFGLIVSIAFLLAKSYQVAYKLEESSKKGPNGERGFNITLSQEINFLNKAPILKTLNALPDYAVVTIDGSQNHHMHHDVVEIFQDFEVNAKARGIELKLINVYPTCNVSEHNTEVANG